MLEDSILANAVVAIVIGIVLVDHDSWNKSMLLLLFRLIMKEVTTFLSHLKPTWIEPGKIRVAGTQLIFSGWVGVEAIRPECNVTQPKPDLTPAWQV